MRLHASTLVKPERAVEELEEMEKAPVRVGIWTLDFMGMMDFDGFLSGVAGIYIYICILYTWCFFFLMAAASSPLSIV